MGFFIISAVPALQEQLNPEERTLSHDPGTPDWLYAFEIYLNNLKICLVAFFGGYLLGFGPCAVVLLNGAFLGISLRYLGQHGIGYVISLLPHLCIEMAAFLIAIALGLMAGQRTWDIVLRKKDKNIRFRQLFETFSIWVNSFLITGALVEVYLSAYMTSILV
jgi:stage II sporulation protein M